MTWETYKGEEFKIDIKINSIWKLTLIELAQETPAW
jgi:hypothetical protein